VLIHHIASPLLQLGTFLSLSGTSGLNWVLLDRLLKSICPSQLKNLTEELLDLLLGDFADQEILLSLNDLVVTYFVKLALVEVLSQSSQKGVWTLISLLVSLDGINF
jgi:hypothetical protein